MDTGTFRPIGEEGKMVHSKVRLLFATTENPKSLITNLLSPNFRNRLTSELQRAPHSRTDCDFKNLFHREAKRMTKDINVDEEIFTALLENDEPGNGEVYPTKCSSFARRNYEKLCPINPSSLAMRLNQ